MTEEEEEEASPSPEPEQLYRASGSMQAALELLERDDLTEDDVRTFLQTGESPTRPLSELLQRQADQHGIYRKRRVEIQDLLRKVPTGEARVDADGRLVPVENPHAPPAIDLPPPPQPQADNNIADGGGAVGGPPWLDAEDQDEAWVRQGERGAVQAVRRVLQRWREEDTQHTNMFLLRVPSTQAPDGLVPPNVLTWRRVFYAVLTAVGCMTAVLLQAMPLADSFHYYYPGNNNAARFTSPSTTHIPPYNKLLDVLLRVRSWQNYTHHCPPSKDDGFFYHRTMTNHEGWRQWIVPKMNAAASWWWRTWRTTQEEYYYDDCADGVLYVPSTLTELHSTATTTNPNKLSWWLPCHSVEGSHPITLMQQPHANIADTGEPTCDNNDTDTTSTGNVHNRCFRGIHEHFASQNEVEAIKDFGAGLILKGGDHHDIYKVDDDFPFSLVPMVDKIKTLLMDTYRVDKVTPVAFRVGAAGPHDGKDVPQQQSQSAGLFPRLKTTTPAVQLLNLTNYVSFLQRIRSRHQYARYSLPWPLRILPHRDECNLMADLQVDERFKIHTMLFLNEDFQGGQALIVDNHPHNCNSRRKIRRGIVVEGARGRLIVSTGGYENRRCRLPLMAGVRAVLQIWWQ